MTNAEVIVDALVAGASAGVGDTAKAVVADAYARLKSMLTHKLSGRPQDLRVLEVPDMDSAEWRERLIRAITACDAAGDADLLAAAYHLRSLVSISAKKVLAINETKNLQVGNHNTQNDSSSSLTFHGPVGHLTVTTGAPPFPPAQPRMA